MGSCLSWVAVQGSSPEAVYADLGFHRSGEFEEIPEAPFCGTRLGNNWTVVVLNGVAAAMDGTINLKHLSRLGDVIACFVEEHVMCSAAACWSAKRQVWSVAHRAEKGMRHLQMSGSLPDSAIDVVQATEAKLVAAGGSESEVDYYFDVPILLAKSVAGFRHDEDVEVGLRFEVLRSADAKWNNQTP
jgi:hypothetical protein